MAVARRKAIEKREDVQKIMSRTGPTGLMAHSEDGRLFFLSSKDAKRTEVSGRDRRTLRNIITKQNGVPRRHSQKVPVACGKTHRWLLSHSPKSKGWRMVSTWWLKNC